MLFHTVPGYTPAFQQENLATYHGARDAFFSEDTAANQQPVTGQIETWRKTCQDAFNQALVALTQHATSNKLPGYQSLCPQLQREKIETLEGYQAARNSFRGCDNTDFEKKLLALYQAHDANLSLLRTHEDKLYANQQLTALLDEADKPEQPENQIQYIWNTLVAWFTTCYYRTTLEDHDTTREAMTTLKTVSQNITSALQPRHNDFHQKLNPEKPYEFTDVKIKALGEGSLGRTLQTFIDNGSADILANTRVHTVPELIEALEANHPSPEQTEQQKAKQRLSHLFTKYFNKRIGSGPKQTSPQYYWGGLFSRSLNSKSLDEKIFVIRKLCSKIDKLGIESTESLSGQFTRGFNSNPSRTNYFNFHSQPTELFKYNNYIPSFTPEEVETLNNGNLGKALRAFINDKHASALLGQEINSLADFLTAVDVASAPKQGQYTY
jgi:hypothetical protein